MSALATISNKEELIQRVCVARDEKVGVYGFVFHRDGEWISEVIDDKLFLIKENFDEAKLERYHWLELQNRKSPEEEYRTVMQTGSRALYFAQCSDPNETWLPLLEKAFAKAHGDYAAIDGGFVGEGIEDLTGGVTSEVFATDILDKDKFWEEELMNVNKNFLFGCGQMGGVYGARKGIQEKHAYSVMEARQIDGVRLLKLRNPWGRTEWTGRWSDGSEEWTADWMHKLNHKFGDDGVFWISYEDMLRNYQHFDRTRLFGPEWTVSQQWTSVDVPWSVDYLDTKFKISLAKNSPVVIVLSQLDDRYFRGLEGQYEFHLQFRLHKDDEEDYIVRSNGTYYMKRSVSTELDLEAGDYTVLLKIKATRIANNLKPDEVIRQTCTKRREKLLAIGLSYDLAHAKGQFVQQEREKAQNLKEQKIERKKAELRKAHKRHEKLRKRAERREQKRAMKATRQMSRPRDSKEAIVRLRDFNGLGITSEDENRVSADDESKPVHSVISRHRASSTEMLRERSSSPSGGFSGRGGYNGPSPEGIQGRQSSPATQSQLFRGRGGYNQNMIGDLHGRGGYNQNMPGELQGRGGYNQNMPGELQGRGGYNIDPLGANQAREGHITDSPVPVPQVDDLQPETNTQPIYSAWPERRSPAPSRRATLTPIPGVRPGIQLNRSRGHSMNSARACSAMQEMSEYSSWDSEIDGPCSLDSDFSDEDDDGPRYATERQFKYMGYNGARCLEEDEFERDPWNAVCVVGLRVFSKDNTDVTIEVHRSDDRPRKKSNADDVSVESMGTMRRKETELDVDDSAADATSPMRTRTTTLDDELKKRNNESQLEKVVAIAPK